MKTRSRLRSRLLILLWIGAGCLLLVAVFENRSESDGIQPRALLHRGPNLAENMLGEPHGDADRAELQALQGQVAPRSPVLGPLDEAMAAVTRHRAQRSLSSLELIATEATDSRVRIRALAALAEVFGAEARPILHAVVEDSDQTDKVRREAARFLGRTGTDAGTELESLIESDLPARVRGGAVLGLAEMGTAGGATRILEIAALPEHPMRLEAAAALGRVFAPEAARALAALLTDETANSTLQVSASTRATLCRSLGHSRVPEARSPLEDMLKNDESAEVRAAAANALGILGNRGAMEALVAARTDPAPDVAPVVELALSRLANVRD